MIIGMFNFPRPLFSYFCFLFKAIHSLVFALVFAEFFDVFLIIIPHIRVIFFFISHRYIDIIAYLQNKARGVYPQFIYRQID